MQIHTYRIGSGSRGGNVLLGMVAVAAGLALLVFGFVLIASLAVVGGVVGSAVMLVRRLRGRTDARPRFEPPDAWRAGLDPRLEVRPLDDDTASRRLDAPRD